MQGLLERMDAGAWVPRLLQVGLVLSVAAFFAFVPGCPSAGDGAAGPAAGEIGGACLGDGTCTEGFCFAVDNVCVRCFEEGVACTNSEQCCEDLECVDGECAVAVDLCEGVVCDEGFECDPETGDCVLIPVIPCTTDEECDDDDLCTDDACVDAACENTAVACDEGFECDPATGECVPAVVECDPPCAADEVCEDGVCVPVVVECESNDDCPDDGLYCTGAESCDLTADPAVCVSSGDPCTGNTVCNEDTDLCEAVGCESNADCPDDGLYCTGTESCDLTADPPVCVSSGDPCPADTTCNDETDTCEAPPVDDDLEAGNPDVTFDNLTAGTGVELTAPVATTPRQVVIADCVCTWSVDGAGAFDPNPGCTTTYTPAADDTLVTVTVVCIDPITADEFEDDFNQTVVVTAGVACIEDAECDDGLFCTGAETCVDNLCVAGVDPCTAGETCDEDADGCVAGETIITLTKEIDTVTGTAVNETIRGAVKATDSTLDAGDSIDGGGGTDRLEVSLSGNTNYDGLADIRRVEDYFIRNADSANALLFSLTGSTDYLALWSDRSSSALTFTGMDTLAEIGLFQTDEDLTATFDDSVLAAAGDTVWLNLNEAEFTFNATTDAFTGSTVVIQSASGAGAPADGGPETIVVNSTGDEPNGIASIDDGGENDFDTLQIEGDQDLQIDAIGGSVTLVDATVGGSFTGDLDIDVSGADAQDITVTLGNGDSTVRVGTTDNGDTITGGTGANDRLIVSGATFNDTAMTGVEDLEFDSTGATVTFDLDSAPGVAQVTIDESGGALTTITGTNCPDNFTLLLDTADDFTISGASTLTSDPALTGPECTIQIGGTANHIQLTTLGIDLGNYSELTVNTTVNQLTLAVAQAFNAGGANNITQVNILGSSTVNIGATLVDDVIFDTLDASDAGFTGLLNMILPANSNALEIDGSAGFDILLGDAGNDEIDGNGGGDTITGGNGDDDLDGGSGNDTITGGGGADTLTGGTEADDFRYAAFTDGAAADDITAANADSIVGFVSGTDDVEFANAILATLVGGAGTGQVITTVAASGTADFNAGNGGVYVYTDAVAAGGLSTFASVAAAAHAGATDAFLNLAAGETAVLVFNDGTDTGIYYFTDADANQTLDAADVLTLLGIVDEEVLVAGDLGNY